MRSCLASLLVLLPLSSLAATTGVWTSYGATKTAVITTQSAGGKCGFNKGTRTVCATPTASCVTKAGSVGTSTCRAASLTTARSSSVAPSSTGNWLKPKVGDTFLWSLERQIPDGATSNTGVKLGSLKIYDIDLFDSTKAQIAAYKQKGHPVVCYYSAGTVEDWRTDVKAISKSCYQNAPMESWAGEYWLDIHSSSCLAEVHALVKSRIELAKSKGCDAIEPDNTDLYTQNSKSNKYGVTITDQFNYLKFMADTAHNLGLGIALKNGPDMISKRPEVVAFHDFSVIEECAAYKECKAYKPFVDAGKAAIQVEYERSIDCSKDVLPGFFALAYSKYNVDYKYITKICPAAP